MLQKFNTQFNRAQKDRLSQDLQSDIQSSSDVTSETFNINTGYLLTILRLIDEYNIIKINGIQGVGKNNPDYFYQLTELLESIMILLSPKMVPPKMTEEERNNMETEFLNIIETIETVFQHTPNGMFIDGKKAFETRMRLNNIMRTILGFMEKAGMLTFKSDDPHLAMGKFSD